ncbi:hypothetical protein ACIBKY_50875 [Nonomuraea sp. NPDC050394]|uniref:hypothetical protein n=1 Tax=Nonomuraea sp. NPDC050394 TaxID=3364363 RepID=UPI00379573A0
MSVRSWRIDRVEEGPTTWLVHYEPESGGATPFAASIPKEAFEHRMAEHGLQTLDEAIDALLYAPLLSWMAAAGDADGQVLLEGEAGQARERLLGQIAACKERYGELVTTAAAARGRRAVDPLAAIRKSTRIDPVRVAALRMEIDRFLVAQDERTFRP